MGIMDMAETTVAGVQRGASSGEREEMSGHGVREGALAANLVGVLDVPWCFAALPAGGAFPPRGSGGSGTQHFSIADDSIITDQEYEVIESDATVYEQVDSDDGD